MVRAPWYRANYRLWQRLPWASVTVRRLVQTFAYYHTLRRLPQCQAIINLLQFLECYEAQIVPPELEDPCSTLYSMIRLLMLASIDLRTPASIPDQDGTELAVYPSVEAQPFFFANGVRSLGPCMLCLPVQNQYITLNIEIDFISHQSIFAVLWQRLIKLETTNGAPLYVISLFIILSSDS